MDNMKILLVVGFVIFVFGFFYFLSIKEDKDVLVSREFISCLKEEGVVIYGSPWCPACSQLVENFGGYKKIEPIYVDCTEEEERCELEKLTEYVPEIQIKENLYEGPRNLEDIAKETSCEL